MPRALVRITLAGLLFAGLAGCKDKAPATAAVGSGSSSGSGSGDGSGSSSGDGYQGQGKRPAQARRPTPPPTLAPLAVGTAAPAIELLDSTSTPWKLADAFGKWQRVVVVFYRGDW